MECRTKTALAGYVLVRDGLGELEYGHDPPENCTNRSLRRLLRNSVWESTTKA